MTHTDSPEGTQRKARSKTFTALPWVGTGLFIIVLVVGVLLLATKQIAFVSSNPSTVTSVVTRACDAKTIATYNTYFSGISADAQSAALKSAFDAATASPNYAADPNCVYIRYQYYANNKDAANAQKQIDVLQALADKKLYATSEIVNVQSIDALRLDLKLLNTSDTQTDQSTNGQG